MLVWSGCQCWSDGLIPLLKTYTLPILTMVRIVIRFYYFIENKINTYLISQSIN